ncbi:hypothetical protein D3C86_2232240 [compost metagenome]
MLQFEVEIVVVRVRAETDLFDNHFLCFCLDLLLFLFLLVFELGVVHYFTDWRNCCWCNLHQVK